jgi:hypothetical protein
MPDRHTGAVPKDDPRDPLRRIARHLAIFESPGFRFGSWVRSRRRDDGVLVMGWYEPGPEAEAFLGDARAMITAFDWPAWASGPDGRALLGHPDAVASASADDLRRLLTVYVRSERFGDGTLEAAFASGMLTAIIRRAAVLSSD